MRSSVPPPHVAEQDSHEPQVPHSQFTDRKDHSSLNDSEIPNLTELYLEVVAVVEV